ncbi:hypothetical protein BGW38_009037 [Lunasporangiospora selenospora]|uniref:PIN domain-containing protein n=1 Tax=Lunasporangiospora selenospora TaxID=979761 RepID=A0A9P6FZK0_9FUNG|nr:hypothetical protein BGW38_009037 [Lunasporangiospora selenospora]
MSSSTSQISLENHLQLVRQLYRDASVLEQSIQQHVEANKIGYRSNTSLPSSPVNDRRASTAESQQQQGRRQTSTASPQRRSGRTSSQQSNQSQQDESSFQSLSSSNFRSNQEELTFLRDSLKDVYEAILLGDLTAAAEKSVDERLWRHVFYTPVEELRAELRKLGKNEPRRQEVMSELSKLLDKGTGFYHELITAMRSDHDVDLNTLAVEVLLADSGTPAKGGNKYHHDPQDDSSSQPQSRSKGGRSRQQSRAKDEPTTLNYSRETLANSIQKCFVYLGDLARYRTNIRLEAKAAELAAPNSPSAGRSALPNKPPASDWEAARRFYGSAIWTFPDSGKAYGQLAILATYANDDLDALYWYSLSLGAKCPSVVVRDNLKVFFSRYQNRYKDVLGLICSAHEGDRNRDDSNMDGSVNRHLSEPSVDTPLEGCDLGVLFVKIQMDLFAPRLESATFQKWSVVEVLCKTLHRRLGDEGYTTTVMKMVACLVFTIWDLHSRTTSSSFSAESSAKEGVMSMNQAQKTGLVYLLNIATVLLDHQLSRLENGATQLDQSVLFPVHIMIEYWLSHWDHIWGMIRLEDKWTMTSTLSDLSLRKATVNFFRSFVNLLNMVRPTETSQEDITFRALCLLQQDRVYFFGLQPFRRFQSQLSICYDVVENPEETRLYRLLYFAGKVVQASEGIRGTVVEVTMESGSDPEDVGVVHYSLMDADDRRVLRERGSKVLASHWLQDQVSTLQKDRENVGQRDFPSRSSSGYQNGHGGGRGGRGLVALSTLPNTVRLPSTQAIAAKEGGQSLLTDHFHKGGNRSGTPPQQQQQLQRGGRPYSKKQTVLHWTCIVDFSVLVWHLADIKTLLEHRRCLVVVPLDVIDRLDKAKKGQEKENLKTREAIRFLDNRLNIPQWGMTEPLLVAQKMTDSLSRWSESVPLLVEEDIIMKDAEMENSSLEETLEEKTKKQPEDVDMDSTPGAADGFNSKMEVDSTGNRIDRSEGEEEEGEEGEEEEQVEVRNAMKVPRVWRPILGACLNMLRKREESQRIPQDRFILLTEDPELEYYSRWFDIPTSSILTWKQNGI